MHFGSAVRNMNGVPQNNQMQLTSGAAQALAAARS
jgi:hypothetical protein